MTSRWWFDVVSAWKGVRGGRWASVVAVVALGLGIGASVTAAAVAYGGLLRPLPFADPLRLFVLTETFVPTALESGVSLADFDRWRPRLSGTAQLVASSGGAVTIRGAAAPQQARASYVLGPFFEVLGTPAEAGRVFTDDGTLDVAVVSHRFAVRLAGDPAAAVGRAITAGARSLRVAGVMPLSFSTVGEDVDVWMPARGVEAQRIIGNTDSRYYTMIARMTAGASREALRANAEAALHEIEPPNQRGNWHVAVKPMRDVLIGDSRPVLGVFMAASSLVLLIACANVAMLLVNRAVARSREFTLRLALGASRARLLRTAVLETAMLATAGAVLGWWMATVATAAIAQQTGLGVPRFASVTLSAPVAAGAALAAVLVVLICGAAPLVGVRHAHLATSLRAGTSTGSRQSRRFRSALVVAQLATAIVLLVGAGLLGRTLLVLTHTDLGLSSPHHVMTMAVPAGESTSAVDRTAQSAVLERVLAEARQQPGVQWAGLGSNLPPSSAQVMFTVRYVSGDRDQTTKMDIVSVTDGYLDALGARVVRGRLFEASDFERDQPVAVLSLTAMRHLGLKETVVDHDLNMQLPSASGQRVKPRVIGVVGDIRYSGIDTPANGGIYVLWRQIPMAQAYLVLRASGQPDALASAVSRIVRAADPSLPLASPRPLDAVIDDALAPRHARFSLVGVYAFAAILLAVVGLSGALVRSVSERQRELAIRAAIGATPRDLIRSILRHGLGLAALGATLGIAAALAAGRAAATVLFGVTPYDPLTYVIALAVVLAIAGAASYWPARRAAAANPVVLLRSE